MTTLTHITRFDDNTILAENLDAFYVEVEACQGMKCWDGTTFFVVTNLGELAGAKHLAMSPISRHNRMWCPDGWFRVCALDFGGEFASYTKIAEFWQALYKAKDDRVFPWGFAQFGDGTGLSWDGGGRKFTGKDYGHSHVDNNMAGPQLTSRNSFTASMTSRRYWGLKEFLATGRLGTATSATEDDMFEKADRDALKAVGTTATQAVAEAKGARAQAFEARRMVEVLLGKRPPGQNEAGPARPVPFKTKPLVPGQALLAGEDLWSAYGTYKLSVQTDGNLVEYGPNGVEWALSTVLKRNPACHSLSFQTDGNVVARDISGKAIWSTATNGTGAQTFQVQEDGNMVVRTSAGTAKFDTGARR